VASVFRRVCHPYRCHRCLSGEVFRRRGVSIQAARCQAVLVAMLENGWGEDELAPKLGRVLDLNRWRLGLESQLVGILAEATQAVNGK
jgi:hypothetical protein